MYENNFYEEEEETLFTFDDQDFLKCNNNNNNNNNNSPLSSRRKTTGSSKYYSIPKENYQYGINSYPCVKRERTGIHAKSLPVLIPVDSNSNTSGGGVGSSINKKTTKMRQAVEVETQSNCSSPSWYSQRGVVLTLDNPHHPHLLNHHHNHHNQNNENVLTLEELRNHFNSCFTCGVCWSEEHVSLDCFECGGYSMERPCPLCDGKCNRTWRRDLTMSHAMNKAHWEGECGLASREQEAFYIKNLVDATEDGITEALKDLKASS